MSEQLFIALDAIRMFVLKNVSRTGQRLIAVPTAKMIGMKVLTHSSCVLAVEYKLRKKNEKKR